MIEMKANTLTFSFPEVHPDAKLDIVFQRTLRIPDDNQTYMLPPGLGSFPLRHVDDFAQKVPEKWRERGGVMLPMYQAEAMWLSFQPRGDYPIAVKVAAGKIDAVTGEEWEDGLVPRPDQNYMVVPGQPWLDGYVVEKGRVRQFVAMPLKSGGYTVEEQLTGKAEHGGVQIQVYPLKKKYYDPPRMDARAIRSVASFSMAQNYTVFEQSAAPDMGLAAGGSMRQEIYADRRPLAHWDQAHTSRCFVHLTNALVWRSITGAEPPTVPPTAADYTRNGLPWFDYYAADQEALDAKGALRKIKSIATVAAGKGETPLPENESVDAKNVKHLGPSKRRSFEVREGVF